MSQESLLSVLLVGIGVLSNAAVVASVLYAVRTLRAKPPTSAPSPSLLNPEPLETQRQKATEQISEVLHYHHGEWKHHGWVRNGTRDYQRAMDTPKVALRTAEGALKLGRQ